MQVIEMTSVSSASDIWSVGCLAIELLTGSPPYSELQPMSALFRVVQVRPVPCPGCCGLNARFSFLSGRSMAALVVSYVRAVFTGERCA